MLKHNGRLIDKHPQICPIVEKILVLLKLKDHWTFKCRHTNPLESPEIIFLYFKQKRKNLKWPRYVIHINRHKIYSDASSFKKFANPMKTDKDAQN